jgi:hypothetical protein
MITDISINKDIHEGFITELRGINGAQTVSILNDQSVYHAFTKDNVFEEQQNDRQITSIFTFDNRYSSETF